MKRFIKCFLLVITIMLLSACGSKDEEKKLEDDYQKYGSVEKISVNDAIDNFNKIIVDNNEELKVVDKEKVTIDENKYWFTIKNGIYLVVVPKDFDETKEEIVDYMFLYVDKKDKLESDAIEYSKLMISSINENISLDEASKLMDDAKKLVDSDKTSNNGKGVNVAYLENDDHYEYHALLIYK